jgi:hypothetical protein
MGEACMAKTLVRLGMRASSVIVLSLVLYAAVSCKGSSDSPIISLHSYDVSGRITDNTGAPLADTELLFNGVQVQTAADGSFVFHQVAQGVAGNIVPDAVGVSYLPVSRSVVVGTANITGMDFTGFTISNLQDDLPATSQAGLLISIQLKAVDGAGNALLGYTTGSGTISSEPAGVMVLTSPKFVDGQATAVVRFASQGTYTLCLEGFCDELDKTLGAITVAPGIPQPEIAYVETWQNGAEAAISLSFDDGTEDHWTRGMQLWADYGFRVTLGILANRFLDHPERIPQLQEAFANGHELANHTNTHPDCTTISPAVLEQEMQTCQTLLLNNVDGLDRVLTFIYPYEIQNDAVIATLENDGYLFARSGTQGISETTALNDAWNPSLMHLYAWANLNTMHQALWDDTTDSVLASGGWLIEECHGIGAEGEIGVGWSPRPESDFREHYDHIASYGSQIWVAPISEVGRYVVERNTAQFIYTENTADRITFSLATGLDSSIYNIPLTLWMELPAGWTALSVSQNGAQVPAAETDEGKMRFNIVPGSGMVSVERE